MTYEETIAALWAQAEQTAQWAYLEAENTREIYRKYSSGSKELDPRDLAKIAKSHEELLLRVSAAEIFRTTMLTTAMEGLRAKP